MKILIVGAGFSGAVIARELAETGKHNILVVDERNHIGGNCHTKRDEQTQVMEHVYGPHIFNTSNLQVWNYVNKFVSFKPFINRVKAVTDKGLYSLPINLLTINSFFNKQFNPRDAFNFVKSLSDVSISNPQNFEEQALFLLGKELYENFFKEYTIKQWGVDPKVLPASILKRLPVRFNYDDNYYNTSYQGIPEEGYTVLIERILSHQNISIKLNSKYNSSWNNDFDYIFYSGPLDAYYNFSNGRLGYRSIYFEKNIFHADDYQGNAVLNYCSSSVPYTRIHEHKHFTPWEKHEHSIYLKEYSKETGLDDTPYYPKRLESDIVKLETYKHIAEKESKISFIGRLGTYRYLDMHHVIAESLDFSRKFLKHDGNHISFSRFINE